jgi:endonuclease YncB( thermonuclease family)
VGKKSLVKNRFAWAVFTMHLSHLASLAFALLMLGGCLQQQELPYFEPVETAEVERVIDGDTIVLKNG